MVAFPATTDAQTGNLFVTGSGIGTISQYNPSGASLGLFASGFMYPHGLAFDGSDNLYVADTYGGAIRKFSASGASLGVFASKLAGAIAFDKQGDLFAIAGTIDSQNTIEKFSPSGLDLGAFYTGATQSSFDFYNGLAFDSHGNLHAAERFGPDIVTIAPSGTVLSRVGVPSGSPKGIAFDSSGNMFVAVASFSPTPDAVVRKYDASGTDLGIFVDTGFASGTLGPEIAIDGSGNLFVTNYSGIIREFDATGSHVRDIPSYETACSYLAFAPAAVPEPSSSALLLFGGLAGAAMLRRYRARPALGALGARF